MLLCKGMFGSLATTLYSALWGMVSCRGGTCESVFLLLTCAVFLFRWGVFCCVFLKLCSRVMIGATNPLKSAPGSIRGDYAIVTGKNIIHGSDSVESAEREIGMWFSEDELCDYDTVTASWIYE